MKKVAIYILTVALLIVSVPITFAFNASHIQDLINNGAGKSGKIPRGLTQEPGIQSKLPTTSTGIIQDDLNSYTNGSIVGQGDWSSYVNGGNFIIQDSVTNEGLKALYNNTIADSVVTKAGVALSDGKQSFYVRTENRTNWGAYLPDGNVQVRVTKGPWASGAPGLAFASVSFKKDGNVAYYDVVNDVYKNFDVYNDNEWTKLEIEWRSSDKMARYRVNSGTWTAWDTFANAGGFTNFDNVGFDFALPSGSGGVYFDTLN